MLATVWSMQRQGGAAVRNASNRLTRVWDVSGRLRTILLVMTAGR